MKLFAQYETISYICNVNKTLNEKANANANTKISKKVKRNQKVKRKNSKIMKTKVYKVSREKAIQIAANHNCVSKEVAANYTDSELKEVLRQLRLKANF